MNSIIFTPNQLHTLWSVPLPGRIEVNWDATLDRTLKVMGVGIIARDHLGMVRASMCYAQKYLMDPTAPEALGAWLGAGLGRYMRFPSITLEGDAQEVVLALGIADGSMSKFESLILDAILKGFLSWELCTRA
jgi:hypothetical protein